MAERDQFYSFEEALKELRLREEELKRLVSEGEIRAFREGETMKLRRADVETLRNELSGGEVVDLGDAREELVFEDDADLLDETGMATEEISNVETIIDDDVPDIGEIEPAVEAVEPIEYELEVEEDLEPAAVETRTLRTAAILDEATYEPRAMRITMVVTSLILILALPLAFSATSGKASGIANAIASLFGK